jgi:hypothetical protein
MGRTAQPGEPSCASFINPARANAKACINREINSAVDKTARFGHNRL